MVVSLLNVNAQPLIGEGPMARGSSPRSVARKLRLGQQKQENLQPLNVRKSNVCSLGTSFSALFNSHFF
jgi:hypothetical protein